MDKQKEELYRKLLEDPEGRKRLSNELAVGFSNNLLKSLTVKEYCVPTVEPSNIALFDLDGTLVDYRRKLNQDLQSMKSMEESCIDVEFMGDDEIPSYMKSRINFIRNFPGWWVNLPVLDIGMDVYFQARMVGFQIHVLTKGPHKTITAWSQKAEWVRKHLDSDVLITMTEDKSLVYGKVLVDDFPPYIEGWLKHRPRGLVIMPAHPYNEGYKRGNVIRYIKGKNIEEVTEALRKAYDRKPNEPLS